MYDGYFEFPNIPEAHNFGPKNNLGHSVAHLGVPHLSVPHCHNILIINIYR